MSDEQSQDKSPALGGSVRSAMAWNTVNMVFSQVGLLAIFLILAARLDPVVFGVFALAAVLVDFFQGLGLSSGVDALLQRKDFSRRKLSTAFWCLTGVFLVIALATMASGPLFTRIAASEHAGSVLIALALTLIPMPLQVIPTAIMRYNLDFKGIAIRNIVGSLAGGVAALAVTFTPMAVWALVVQRWVSFGVSTIWMMVSTRWFPSFDFDKPKARDYIASASRIFAAQSVAGATPRVFDLVIAVGFGPVVLGCVRIAARILELLNAALLNPIGQLWMVLMSRAADIPDGRRSTFLQLSSVTALVALPGFVGVALVAPEFVAIALPVDYDLVAAALAVMAGTQIFVPLSNFRNGLLTSMGYLNELIVFSVCDLIVVIAGMITFHHLGLTAVLLAWGFANIASLCVSVPFALRITGVRPGEFMLALVPPYVAVAAMTAAIVGLQFAMPGLDPWPMMLLKVAVGGLCYAAVLLAVFRRQSLDLIATLRAR